MWTENGKQPILSFDKLTSSSKIIFINWIVLGASISQSEQRLDYGLDDRGSIPAGERDLSFLHSIQIGSEAHLASYPLGTGRSFPGIKVAEAWS
jgi:hypothetical protein